MTNRTYITNILNILEYAGIKTSQNLENLPDSICETVYADSQNWIMDFYNTTKEHFNSYSDLINRSESNKMYFMSNKTDIDTIKYMCLFPSSIILMDNFGIGRMEYGKGANISIKKSFIKEIFQNKQYIENDIFTLLPKSFDTYYPYGAIPEINTLGGSYRRRNQYDKINYCGKNGMWIENEYLDSLLVSLPWLYGARPDDYLEIINKYSNYYEHYRIQIYNLLKMFKKGETNIEDLCYDIKNAHIEMKIHFEKAKGELYAKGIHAVVGLAFTFLPLLFDIPSEVKMFLQKIFGTPCVKDILSMIFTEKQNLKYCGSDNPYLITYKWEEITKKKESNKDLK